MKKLLCGLFVLIALTSSAQPAMVKDIYPGVKGSAPANFISIGNKLYFTIRDTLNISGTRYSLYESDGTNNGTKLMLHLGNVDHLTTFNNKIIYIDDTTGNSNLEPWITDLTSGGTQLVKEIFPGYIGSAASCEGILGNTAFLFGSESEQTGHSGFWKTDGTTDGTTFMFYTEKIRTIVFNNKIYYWGRYNGISGLWSFDAQSTQPQLIIKNINAVFSDFPLIIKANAFYYVTSDSIHGSEPWISDGTSAGTHMIKDISPGFSPSCDGGGSSGNTCMVLMNNKVYFNPYSPAYGMELWETDGTDAGTKLTADITPGVSSSSVRFMLSSGNNLFFTAQYPGYSNVLYTSDGTSGGTVALKDTGNSFLIEGSRLWALNGKAFIPCTSINKPEFGVEPFLSDGTQAGTKLLADINPTPYASSISLQRIAAPLVIGKTIYFVANNGVNGLELWKYTDATTSLLTEQKATLNFLIYPNPANNTITINSDDDVDMIEVYSICGKQEFVTTQKNIDISRLTDGLYFIKVYGSHGINTQKFIKQ